MPSIRVVPASLPPLLATPHVFTPKPMGLERERDQGERRVRPTYRSPPPQVFQGQWYLDQDQFDAWYAFYEEQLRAGAEDFDVQVAEQGGESVSWWTARCISTSCGFDEGLYWSVSVELVLQDEIGPVRTPPGILASGGDSDTGGAVLAGSPIFASGSDADTGGFTIGGEPIFASGDDSDTGGFLTDVAPVDGDDFIRVWMGLDVQPAVIDNQDALTAQLMGL